MGLRLVEFVVPRGEGDRVIDVLAEGGAQDGVDAWRMDAGPHRDVVRALVQMERTEALMDRVEQRFGHMEGFRAMLFAVEASLPRIASSEEAETNGDHSDDGTGNALPARISREELYHDVAEVGAPSGGFVALSALATLVAVIGLLQDSVAIVIGAMVLAPLIGPSVALSLATTLADEALAVRAARAMGAGFLVVGAVSVVAGTMLPVDPGLPEIASRTTVSLWDVALGLAVGAAGALAFTTRVSSALVGVMVAVALLPPAVASGLLLGAGHVRESLGALILLLVYVIAVNLAGVSTFFLQGIRPSRWWEAERAKRATRVAIAAWTLLLTGLAVAIYISRQGL